MRLVPPALNMDMIWVSIACLLPQKIIVRCLWSPSLRTRGRLLFTVGRGLPNISEMECSCRLVPTTILRSNFDYFRSLALSSPIGVHANSPNVKA